MREILLGVLGFGFGALSAAGVFTVLVAVSLVPRFAGKTHTGKKIRTYENMIVLGTILGGTYSLYQNRILMWRRWATSVCGFEWSIWTWGEIGLLVLGGVLCGMFVGCFALAIAEMLDSIPIFTRRVRLQKGTGILVLSVAAGKMVGSLLYFWMERSGW